MPRSVLRRRSAAPRKAWGYIRVSDQRQVASGLGLAAQRQAIEEYYRRVLKPRRVAWGGWFVDKAVSANKTPLAQREHGAALVSAVAAGDHIVFAKIDRGFRNLHDFAGMLAHWKTLGAGMHLLDLQVDTTTPVGELIAHIMASVAQWESRRIGERLKEAKAIQAANGYSTNGRPYIGYRIDRSGKLSPDPRTRKLARRIAKLRQNGFTWHEVAEALNRAGARRGQGRAWSPQAVWRVHQVVNLRRRHDRRWRTPWEKAA